MGNVIGRGTVVRMSEETIKRVTAQMQEKREEDHIHTSHTILYRQHG